MDFLGTHRICPNTEYIKVDVWGQANPEQKETLEQEPIAAYVEIESVQHGGIEIIDYLSSDEIDNLYSLIKDKKE